MSYILGYKSLIQQLKAEYKLNPFSILGIDKYSATIDDVKTVFKKLALLHHPDRGGDEEEFKRISSAYEDIVSELMELDPDLTIEVHESFSDLAKNTELPAPDYENLESYFPFETMRTYQPEILAAMKEALLNPAIKYIIGEFPTGIGKSPLLMTAGRASKSAFSLTGTKILQEQLLRDFSEYIKLLKGRSNYRCYKHTKDDGHYTCADSPCRKTKSTRNTCYRESACEYHEHVKMAKEAMITTFNFAAGLAFLHVPNLFKKRNMMLIDECHAFPDNLTDFFGVSLSVKKLQSLGLSSLIPDYSSVAYYGSFISNLISEIKENLKSELLPGTASELENMRAKLASLSEKLNTNNYVLDKVYDKKLGHLASLSIKPIKVDDDSKNFFQKANKIILLSATIVDFPTFMDLMGISTHEAKVIRAESTFPPENRPIYTHFSVGRINKSNLEYMLPLLVKKIEQLLSIYSNKKGILHGHTYNICNYVYDNINPKYKKRLLYPKNSLEQKDILKKHAENPEPTVLLSPSLTEGVDLKEDLARFQALLKTPYPYLGDPVIQKRMEVYPNYYKMKTLLTIVQALGRPIRSETDKADSYLLDGAIYDLIMREVAEARTQNRPCMIPNYILAAIRTQGPSLELGPALN